MIWIRLNVKQCGFPRIPSRLLQPTEKCKRMRKQQCMSKNCTYSWQWSSSKIHQQFSHLESSARTTNVLLSGPVVSYHISLKIGRRIQCNTKNFVSIVALGLSTSSPSSPTSTSWTSFPQDSTDSALRPAITRSQSTRLGTPFLRIHKNQKHN